MTGVRSFEGFDASALPVRFGAAVRGFNPRQYLDKPDRKRLNIMVPLIQFAVAAARLALIDAGIVKGQVDPERFGVVMGTGTIPSELADLGEAARRSACSDRLAIDMKRWGKEGIPTIPPMWLLSHVPNMPASHISILHDAQGPNNSITQTDLGSLLALGEACRKIQQDRADIMLVGGADNKINPITLVRQCKFAVLSGRNDDPVKASRPFDRDRDGAVLGEGSGVLVVEALGHALRRKATIYAEVLGFSAGFDANRSGNGLGRVVRDALNRGKINSGDLDHINAQGYSTKEDDAWEVRGLRKALSDHFPRVFAPKSYLGNLGPAAGAVELACGLLAMQHGELPGTLNFDYPDPEYPIPVQRNRSAIEKACFLKVGSTERGHCAAAVCKAWMGPGGRQ
jgi:3-oxoacyl-[acyl-carrier-protein] synthase II